jgi:hypothetical protein
MRLQYSYQRSITKNFIKDTKINLFVNSWSKKNVKQFCLTFLQLFMYLIDWLKILLFEHLLMAEAFQRHL